MRRVILGVKLAAVGIWTAVCFGAYALLNLVGDVLIRHSDAVPAAPEGVAFITWLLGVFQTIGFGLVIGIWILGVFVILLVGWIARRLAPPPPLPGPEA